MDAKAKARQLFEQDGLPLVQIAEQLGIPSGTVRGWKSKERWNDGTPERSAGALRARENCYEPFQPRNQKATLHGLFARYLPDETRDILQQLETKSPIDVLWDQIQLAYAALIRAQQIMYVKDREDKTETKIGYTDGEKSESERWEVQQAWDKQASFLKAQSTAQAALVRMIQQYDALLRSELVTEEQRARIDQIKAATKRITGDPEAAAEAAKQAVAIADLINHPAPTRSLDDFMPGGANDTLCAADNEAD